MRALSTTPWLQTPVKLFTKMLCLHAMSARAVESCLIMKMCVVTDYRCAQIVYPSLSGPSAMELPYLDVDFE